jgi:hypothetical protein
MTKSTTAQKLRTLLKSVGYSSKDISVRSDGLSVQVTIRRAGIPFSAVESMARQFRQLDYDHATGELLCGGIHVTVSIDSELLDRLSEPYRAPLEAMPIGSWETIGDQDVGRLGPYDYRVSGRHHVAGYMLPRYVAQLAHFSAPTKSTAPDQKSEQVA